MTTEAKVKQFLDTAMRHAQGVQSAAQQELGMADLLARVHNYNETQGMACTSLRMDPYTPCNGDHGSLCMQCPRKKAAAIVVTQLPG